MISSDLNERQRRAVEHPGGPLLVLAGPGTGKTGVLVSRVAHLVEERGVKAGRILALTFSRRAAEEMQSRVLESSEAAAEVEVRTFHSFALRLVRRHYARLGLGRPPEILPTGKQWAIIRDLLYDEDPTGWGLAPGAFERPATVREVYDLMLRARERLLSPKDLEGLAERHGKPHLARAAGLLARYDERLAGGSEVDYEQVVRLAISLFEDGESREGGRPPESYDHILVDEFQDTNRSQLELLRLLSEPSKQTCNVFCVGDDAQSIYGFRGARAENVRDFEAHFPGAKVIELRVNYRSAQPIVTLAGAALSLREISRPREPQVLPREKGGAVTRRVAGGDREEGEWISDRVLELNRAYGVPFEEIAILRRSLLDSGPLVEALRSRGVPVDFSNTPAKTSAGRLAILLRATEGLDPSPKEASRALLSPLSGLSSGAALDLRHMAETSSLSVFGMVREDSLPATLPEEGRERARAVVSAVDRASEEPDFLSRLDLLWKNLPGTRDLFLRHREDAAAARALADTGAFLRAARSYAEATSSATSDREPDASGFLAAGSIVHEDSDTWAPSAPPVAGAVRVMTVHASKGLEFEAVFVSGLSDERFPSRPRGARFVDAGLLAGRGPTSVPDLEAAHGREERRLFYVALTRAKTYLYLTGVEESAEDGARVSPFLEELSGHLAELESPLRARRFWASREEAVEELRRLACDVSKPEEERFAACRALAGMDERPDDPSNPWWRYIEASPGGGPPPQTRDLREREVTALADCPRQAFLRGLASGGPSGGSSGSFGGSGGSMGFGAAFSEGLSEFLASEDGTLFEMVAGVIERRDFGGPAFTEHWIREAREICRGCGEWAWEVRSSFIESGGEWSLRLDGRDVSGRYGPVVWDEGERVLLRVSTGRPRTKAEISRDPSLALRALGAEADGAEVRYPREMLKSGEPTFRELDTSEGWRERFEAEVRGLLTELASGEHPPRPRDEGMCGRCEFRSVCPAHRGDEPWLA